MTPTLWVVAPIQAPSKVGHSERKRRIFPAVGRRIQGCPTGELSAEQTERGFMESQSNGTPLSVKGSLRSPLPPLPRGEARNDARFEGILKNRERSFGSFHSLRMTVYRYRAGQGSNDYHCTVHALTSGFAAVILSESEESFPVLWHCNVTDRVGAVTRSSAVCTNCQRPLAAVRIRKVSSGKGSR